MSGHPEDLLRGALEKIVFFECRLSQLEAELGAARELAAREKDAAASARGREATIEAEMARARAALEDERARSAELIDRVRLLESERERFLAGLIDQARIEAAPREGADPTPADDERAELAGFIAELRAEVERLRPWKEAAERAGLTLDDDPPRAEPHRAEPVPALAARFEAAGRLGLAPAEARRLEARLTTRAERSLYETSMDDLASADGAARRRAADCLRALGSRAAAPLLAAAVGRERDPSVKAALLGALGELGEPAAADIARRALVDQRAPVRAAALEALSALARERAEPDLLRSLGDPSPLVRRRAALLAGFLKGRAAEEALASALADRDAGVARAAALSLSGRPTTRAQGALTRALDHSEASVRRTAAESVSRWSGEALDAEASAAERRRASRRIVDQLAELSEVTLRDAVVSAAEEREPAFAFAASRPAAASAARRPSPSGRGRSGSPRTAGGEGVRFSAALGQPSPSGRGQAASVEATEGEGVRLTATSGQPSPSGRGHVAPRETGEGEGLRQPATPTQPSPSGRGQAASVEATEGEGGRPTATSGQPSPSGRGPVAPRETGQGEGLRQPATPTQPSPSGRGHSESAEPTEGEGVPPSATLADPLEDAVVAEIRAALRGRTLDELAAVVPGGRPAAEVALRSLVASGALTQRGARFFGS
ncbi:MAG TPA: HEAT repeat domain-containing protein [Anaeromyxobacteraceae bacterium]|nr:HEAT repeat domain-containing protein [Anaeromyxobacteraceae bacterium]